MDYLIDRKTRDGRSLQIGIVGHEAVAYLEGAEFARANKIGDYRNAIKNPLPPGYTHLLGRIALTTTEGEMLEQLLSAGRKAEEEDARQKLESAVPGITALRAAWRSYQDADERDRKAMRRMMEDGDNDGAYWPAKTSPKADDLHATYKQLAAEFPRAALYLRAEEQILSTHWADNTRKGAAADRCKEILAAGGSIEDAQAALAVRREVVD